MAGVRSIVFNSKFTVSSSGLLNQSRRFFALKKNSYSYSGSLSCICRSSQMPSLSNRLAIPDHSSLLRTSAPLQNNVLSEEQEYYANKIEELKERTREAFRKESSNKIATLKLIDNLQRLGVGYHFEEEIEFLLKSFADQIAGGCGAVDDLFTTSLQFWLLRHNGFQISSEVFDKFIDKNGMIRESLVEDTDGLLSLYEACHLRTKGDKNLSLALEFTKAHLEKELALKPHLREKVSKSLKLPRHLRMVRLESRNYIDEYGNEKDCNLDILELAKLDFDMVQLLHRSEFMETKRWWRQLGLVDKFSFARDTPEECFLWSLGVFPESHQSNCRIELSKTVAILQVIDDMFDSYASLHDLVLFTDAIRRWDLGAMEGLPEYMKICYMALYNTTNDIAYGILRKHGWVVVSKLKRTWIDLIEAYLVEARWFNESYVPTLEEYLANSVVSGGTLMALVHSFFVMGEDVNEDTVALMEPYPKLLSCSGTILRLWDDLGTAEVEKIRGDVAKSIDCYMKQKNLTGEDEARDHIREMIKSLWLELNEELVNPSLPLSISQASFNLSRAAQVIYQHGYDKEAFSVDDHAQTLIYRPIGVERERPIDAYLLNN